MISADQPIQTYKGPNIFGDDDEDQQ
jgi:hypothetical protein